MSAPFPREAFIGIRLLPTLLSCIHDEWIHPDRAESGQRSAFVFLAITALIATTCLVLGPYPITLYPQDTLYFLTQGDLLLRGYRPSVDYHSMHGPFPFLFAAGAMGIEGVSLRSVVLAQVAGAVVFGMAMFRIASGRVNQWWALVLAIAVELVLVSCTPTGSKTWREFTCAMWYNILGYCIDAIVFLYLLAPTSRRSKIGVFVDDAIVALLLAALFLTKFSFFLPTAVVFVVGAVIWPRAPLSRIQGIAILAVSALITWGISIALEGSVMAAFGLIDSLSLRVSPAAAGLRFIQYTRTIGLFALGLFLVGWLAKEAEVLGRLKREVVLVFLMLGTLLASASTSAQDQEQLPLVGVILLGLIAITTALIRGKLLPVNAYLLSPALAVVLLLLVHEPKNSILSWIFSHSLRVQTLSSPVEHFTVSEQGDLEEYLDSSVDRSLLSQMPKEWMDFQFQGISLLKAAGVTREDILFVAADVSPINMLTGIRYPAGTVVWWPSRFIDKPENNKLMERRLFADAGYILRHRSDEVFWKFLMHHRGAYFARNFKAIAENSQWILYARQPSDSSSAADAATATDR